MKVRMLQTLTLNGVTFRKGAEADLPTNVAIACLRRGTAQRADLPYETPVAEAPQNRVELPPENRSQNEPGAQGESEETSSVESSDEELSASVEGQDQVEEGVLPPENEEEADE